MGKYYYNNTLDDNFGQLGISIDDIGKNYITPKFCSFNIIITSISCGDKHTALITSNTSFNLR